MKGILYGIGTGPGDPELLTIKALNKIKSSHVIVLPAARREECYAYRIVREIYPDLDRKEILCLEFPMIKEKEQLEAAHEQIYSRLREILAQGKQAAFLTIGDPGIYSTYMYVHKKAVQEGFPAYIISGIPSFCAAAASLGISLGEGREEIHIIPASYEVKEALSFKGTRIFMKSGKQLVKLKEAILHSTDKGRWDIYAISNCGMETEKIYAEVEELSEESGYLTIVIIKDKR